MDSYTADIGIECHVQLKTRSKLFCGCDNDARQAEPNTTVCPVCLGLPGSLPVLNKGAVELAIQAGLALGCEIATETKFDRKNYFYPDLPKGYQITQYDQPIVGWGKVEISSGSETFAVGITRAHLEEDAGKLTHPSGADYSLVDLNRAGTPLLEIVSEPDMHSPAQAKAYAQELYQRLRYAGVSDVDLYHGNMRFDVNVSVRKIGEATLGTRSETKNLNSFRSVERASEYEIKRQIELLEKGGQIVQETRGFDDATGKTSSQRSKEEAADYRYFPEPDLPPLVISESMKTELKAALPPLVGEFCREFKDAGLSYNQIEAILNEPRLATLQREVMQQQPKAAITVANWLSGEVSRLVKTKGFDWAELRLDAKRIIELHDMVAQNKLSSSAAKTVLGVMMASQATPAKIAADKNLLQVSDTAALEMIVDEVITANPKAAADVRGGEARAIGFLVGQVMQRSKGQANPQMVNELLGKKIDQAP